MYYRPGTILSVLYALTNLFLKKKKQPLLLSLFCR